MDGVLAELPALQQLLPGLLLGAAVLLVILHLRPPGSKRSASGLKIPPGPRFLIPGLGETPAVLKEGLTQFFVTRYARYKAPLYKTQIFGGRFNLVLDPALAPKLTRGDGVLFAVAIPGFATLMGDMRHVLQVDVLQLFRKSYLGSIGPRAVADFVSAIVEVAERHVAAWRAAGGVELQHATSHLSVDFTLDALLDLQLRHVQRDWFTQRLITFLHGLMCAPVAVPEVRLPGLGTVYPGTGFWHALQAREDLLRALAREVEPEVAVALREEPGCGADARDGADPDLLMKDATRDQFARSDAGGNMMGDKDAAHRAYAAALQRLGRGEAADGAASGAGGALSVQEGVVETLRYGRQLSARCIADRLLGTFMASVDSTGRSSMIALLLLGLLPEEQDKLRQELRQATGGRALEEVPITADLLARLPYLDAVVKECQRLIPAQHMLMRTALRDLDLGGYLVRKGEHLMIPIEQMHAMDAACWDGKLEVGRVPPHMDWRGDLRGAFRPERWLSDATKPRAYHAFGQGMHSCLGMWLAYTELKVLVLAMLRAGGAWSCADPHILQTITVLPDMQAAKPGGDGIVFSAPAPAAATA